jgi:hypothetical protein
MTYAFLSEILQVSMVAAETAAQDQSQEDIIPEF